MKKLILLATLLFSIGPWAEEFEYCVVNSANGSQGKCYPTLEECQLNSTGGYDTCVARPRQQQ
jgi:hypothetical protein